MYRCHVRPCGLAGLAGLVGLLNRPTRFFGNTFSYNTLFWKRQEREFDIRVKNDKNFFFLKFPLFLS